MTFNWGHRLLLVFAVFGTMIAVLVYKSIHTNYDLVATEYYKDELAYQHIIDGMNNTNALKQKVTLQQSGKQLQLQLPFDTEVFNGSGSIHFYCPADARLDSKHPIDANNKGLQLLDIRSINTGNYIVKISWTNNGIPYYTEQPITIQ